MANKYQHLADQAAYNRIKWRSCLSKKPFSNKLAAEAQGGMGVYRCAYYSHWHRRKLNANDKLLIKARAKNESN